MKIALVGTIGSDSSTLAVEPLSSTLAGITAKECSRRDLEDDSADDCWELLPNVTDSMRDCMKVFIYWKTLVKKT